MCDDIAARPLPFLVDVGGRPKPWDEAVFDQCSHAILLTTETESPEFWRNLVHKYNLILLADLTSQLSGQSALTAEQPVLKGTITQLSRGQAAQGVVFEALLARLKALFGYGYGELFNIHQAQAPVELVVDINHLRRRISPHRPGLTWQAQELPATLADLPHDSPLALYGLGPAWLYAAVARYIAPQDFYQFDARRGWVKPPLFTPAKPGRSNIAMTAAETPEFSYLKFDLLEDYLEYAPAIPLSLPPPPSGKGLILSGKLPNWLYTGLTLFYQHTAWVAIYYPHSNEGIVVSVNDAGGEFRVGQTIGLDRMAI
jgi:CRISPR-associated protein Csx3